MKKIRRDDLENQLNRSALWAVTYGDLMSYLMIFFLFMFSYGITKKSVNKEEQTLLSIQKVFGGKDSERLKKLKSEEDMAKQLKKEVEASNQQIETKEGKIHIRLNDAVLFDSGKAELSAKAKTLLGTFSGSLKSMLASMPKNSEIHIEGHTDNIPIRGGRYSSNMELSMARAYAVVSFFESTGIPAQLLAGIGYGEFRPLQNNTTAEGRAKNRRIEINMIRAEQP